LRSKNRQECLSYRPAPLLGERRGIIRSRNLVTENNERTLAGRTDFSLLVVREDDKKAYQ